MPMFKMNVDEFVIRWNFEDSKWDFNVLNSCSDVKVAKHFGTKTYRLSERASYDWDAMTVPPSGLIYQFVNVLANDTQIVRIFGIDEADAYCDEHNET